MDAWSDVMELSTWSAAVSQPNLVDLGPFAGRAWDFFAALAIYDVSVAADGASGSSRRPWSVTDRGHWLAVDHTDPMWRQRAIGHIEVHDGHVTDFTVDDRPLWTLTSRMVSPDGEYTGIVYGNLHGPFSPDMIVLTTTLLDDPINIVRAMKKSRRVEGTFEVATVHGDCTGTAAHWHRVGGGMVGRVELPAIGSAPVAVQHVTLPAPGSRASGTQIELDQIPPTASEVPDITPSMALVWMLNECTQSQVAVTDEDLTDLLFVDEVFVDDGVSTEFVDGVIRRSTKWLRNVGNSGLYAASTDQVTFAPTSDGLIIAGLDTIPSPLTACLFQSFALSATPDGPPIRVRPHD